MFKVVETEALATAHAPDPSADWLELMRRRVVEDKAREPRSPASVTVAVAQNK